MKVRWLVVTVAVVALAVAATATAEEGIGDAPAWVDSSTGMEGLTELGVFVIVDDDMAKALSVSGSEITTQVELYLREVPGITVADPVPGPTLCVQVEGILTQYEGGRETGGYSGDVTLMLLQPAWVVRPGRVLRVRATTWDKSYNISGQRGEEAGDLARRLLTRLLDQFQNEYLKANPQIKP